MYQNVLINWRFFTLKLSTTGPDVLEEIIGECIRGPVFLSHPVYESSLKSI